MFGDGRRPFDAGARDDGTGVALDVGVAGTRGGASTATPAVVVPSGCAEVALGVAEPVGSVREQPTTARIESAAQRLAPLTSGMQVTMPNDTTLSRRLLTG